MARPAARAILLALLLAVPASAELSKAISLNVRDSELRQIFHLLGRLADVNVLVDPQIRGKMTVNLKDVTAEQAFYLVASITGHKVGIVQGVVIVAKEEILLNMLGPLRAKVRRLGYSRSDDVAALMTKLFPKQLVVVSEPRTNSVILLQGGGR